MNTLLLSHAKRQSGVESTIDKRPRNSDRNLRKHYLCHRCIVGDSFLASGCGELDWESYSWVATTSQSADSHVMRWFSVVRTE